MSLSPEELEQIGSAVAEHLEHNCAKMLGGQIMMTFGIDWTSEQARAEVRKDMEWLRRSREGIDLREAEEDHRFIRSIRRHGARSVNQILSAMTWLVILGALALAGWGIKEKIGPL